MDLGLGERAYVETGGRRGLGYAAAECLVAAGARVVAARDADRVGQRWSGLAPSRPGLAGVAKDAKDAKDTADEHGPRGERVFTLVPGRILIDRNADLLAATGDAELARAPAATMPLRRQGEPAKFGRVAAFLLSPAASYLTGVSVRVDGGAIRPL